MGWTTDFLLLYNDLGLNRENHKIKQFILSTSSGKNTIFILKQNPLGKFGNYIIDQVSVSRTFDN